MIKINNNHQNLYAFDSIVNFMEFDQVFDKMSNNNDEEKYIQEKNIPIDDEISIGINICNESNIKETVFNNNDLEDEICK